MPEVWTPVVSGAVADITISRNFIFLHFSKVCNSTGLNVQRGILAYFKHKVAQHVNSAIEERVSKYSQY